MDAGLYKLFAGRFSVAWDPLDWVRRMDWYQRMLHADWFQPIRPYWSRYYLDWVIVGVGVLLLIWAIRRFLRRPSAGPRGAKRAKAMSRKAAVQYLEADEPMLAADAWLEAGELNKALRILVEQQAWARAAEVAEQLGRLEEAADLYERAKDPVSAARVLVADGQIDRAADIYRRERRLVEAAGLYLETGQRIKAAEHYRQAGLFGKAAELFSEAGEALLAAECLLQLMRESSGSLLAEHTELLRTGGAVLSKAGRVRDAAEMLKAAGDLSQAASHFARCGDAQEAADCYERLGDLRRAADLTRDPEKTLQLLERLRRQGGGVSEREMAQALVRAGRHDKAAEIYRAQGDAQAALQAQLEAGDLADAAAVLIEQGRHAEAAEIFVQAGDLAAAGEQYQLAGDPLAAAELAFRSGALFDAGRAFFDLDEMERAVDALQQIDATHVDYAQASSLLGQAFYRLGDVQMAHRMHLRATASSKMDRDNLSLFYQLARFLESTGDAADLGQAKRVYADILEVSYNFADVKQRHDRIPSVPDDTAG